MTSEVRSAAGEIWALLEEVKDPEIPVVSVVEMGLIRSVDVVDGRANICLTPTFAGCPALQVMQEDIREMLAQAGFEVEIKISYSPPWSSDWITEAARQKLKAFGLAPPPRHGGLINLDLLEVVACPYCGSHQTTLQNSFGPTLCRAIYTCQACRQPFEQFKAI